MLLLSISVRGVSKKTTCYITFVYSHQVASFLYDLPSADDVALHSGFTCLKDVWGHEVQA